MRELTNQSVRGCFFCFFLKKQARGRRGQRDRGIRGGGGPQSGLRSATTRSAKIPCKYIKTSIWRSSEVHGMVGMGPDGLEIVANYAARQHDGTIKSLKKTKNVCVISLQGMRHRNLL